MQRHRRPFWPILEIFKAQIAIYYLRVTHRLGTTDCTEVIVIMMVIMEALSQLKRVSHDGDGDDDGDVLAWLVSLKIPLYCIIHSKHINYIIAKQTVSNIVYLVITGGLSDVR